MAFGFKYKVTLVLVHRSMNAVAIRDRLSTLEPTRAVTAGDIKVFKSGRQRPASNSVWESRLHAANELDSEVTPLSAFLETCLRKLDGFKDFFIEVREDGNARLEILWYSDTIHSAGVIEPEVLAHIGNTGLSLDLEYYYRENKNRSDLPS